MKLYVFIVSNILDLPAKVIFSANHLHAAGQFYDDKPRKLGGKPQLVNTDSSEIHIFIRNGLSYLPVSCTTDEEIESLTKVLLTPSGEYKPSYLGNDG